MGDTRLIKTPLTHPDHEVVGRRIMAHDGHVYVCDSYDPHIGYWMTREDAPPDRWADKHSEYRRNVSERAIHRTFYPITEYADGFRTCGMHTHRAIPPAPLMSPLDQFRAARRPDPAHPGAAAHDVGRAGT